MTIVLIAAACFLIGAGLGHLYSRAAGGSAQTKREMQRKLEETEQNLKRYQQDVTEHFVKISQLTANLAQSYREIHEQLTTGAVRLAGPEVGRQMLKASGEDARFVDSEGRPLLSADQLAPPRDYAPKVPGGVLSEEYGLREQENEIAAKPPGTAVVDVDEDDSADPTQRIAG